MDLNENASGKRDEQTDDGIVEIKNRIGWRWLDNHSDSDSDVENDTITVEGITQKLANWATTYRIQQCVVGFFANYLEAYVPINPKRSTYSSENIHTALIGVGEYCHVGLMKGISSLLSRYPQTIDRIELQVNVASVPLFKSSNSTLWPILCSVINVDAKNPFVVENSYVVVCFAEMRSRRVMQNLCRTSLPKQLI